ncbi:glycosyltransferase family 4 protein [uncultured Clostridium sp.]|uniref:glycosyltransferase family 4 protein n=1 Tax=uncultured Clostridium sp. TaxID=59620 RepID=UPI0025965D2B|nr:glycosyltransferase family 4 protein [uncultured Clostridium sp.]
MKIAIICPQGLPVPAVKGGAIETLIDVIIKENEEKNKLDIDVYTIFDKEAVKESQKYKNSKFIFLCKHKKYIKIRNKFISFLRKVLKLNISYTYPQKVAKELKKINYDRVIVEGDSSLIGAISKVVPKQSIYLHIHHNPYTTNNDTFKGELLLCNKVIGVSDFITKGILNCIGDKTFNAETLKNCTNTKIFNKELYKNEVMMYRKKYNIEPDDIVIIFTGRPIQIKGIKELLIAFKDLTNKYKNIKLLIVGNSGFGNQVVTPFEQELLEISKEISDKVIFTGFINNEVVPYMHSISDIAVVPSICEDSAPLVVLEYMSSGLPLIVTNSGGIPEYVNKECAITIERDEKIIENIKIALEKLIENKKTRDKMSIIAHNSAQKFSHNRYYEDFISIIK